MTASHGIDGSTVLAPGITTVASDAPPPVEPAVPASPAGTPVTGSRVATTVDILLAMFQPLEARIQAALEPQPTGHRVGTVNATREAAAPRVASLVRNHAALGVACNPAVVDSSLQDLAASRGAAARLRSLANLVEYNGKLSFDAAWTQCRMAISLAESISTRDDAMNTDLGPVRDALARGKLTTLTAQKAANAVRAASAAQQRATSAQHRATKAQRVAARVAQAHADQHPAAGPVPLASPQGPGASADVTPQGPAPGTSPGSTTPR